MTKTTITRRRRLALAVQLRRLVRAEWTRAERAFAHRLARRALTAPPAEVARLENWLSM